VGHIPLHKSSWVGVTLRIPDTLSREEANVVTL
jgi:hypothetical protein